MNPDELLTAMISITSRTTVDNALSAVAALPIDENTKKIGVICFAASMSVKRNVENARIASGVTLPSTWLVNNTINFTLCAMVGHLLFFIPRERLTAKGREAAVAYARALNGNANLSQFGVKGTVPGSEMRTNILREWVVKTEKVDPELVYKVFSRAFPNLVYSSVASRAWYSRINIFRMIFSLIIFILKSAWRYKFMITFFILLSSDFSRTVLTYIIDTIFNFISYVYNFCYNLAAGIFGIDKPINRAISAVEAVIDIIEDETGTLTILHPSMISSNYLIPITSKIRSFFLKMSWLYVFEQSVKNIIDGVKFAKSMIAEVNEKIANSALDITNDTGMDVIKNVSFSTSNETGQGRVEDNSTFVTSGPNIINETVTIAADSTVEERINPPSEVVAAIRGISNDTVKYKEKEKDKNKLIRKYYKKP